MLFFFSYARADLTDYLRTFYSDLRDEVRSQSGLSEDEVGFRDADSIEPGKPWPDKIVHELRSCRVFVYLHSPTYFTREGCGREFRVIKNRITAGAGLAADLSHVSSIQPIYWGGRKRLSNVPPEIANIQLAHEDYGDEYERQGMLQITRALGRGKEYWTAVKAIAERILRAAEDAPLPEAPESPEWDDIIPLFPVEGEAAPMAASTTANKPPRPPTYARFVWVVGDKGELAGCTEALERYDTDGRPEEWRPFLPESSDPVRLLASDAARKVDLTYERLPSPQTQQELQSLIEQAGKDYTPIVVVVDLWSLRLGRYQAVLRMFDQGTLHNCVVVFPWNPTDRDTHRCQAVLRQTLGDVFPVQFYKPQSSLFFEGIADVPTFKAEISRLLFGYIADVTRRSEVARELPDGSAFSAPPQLGSTPASP